MAAPVIAPQISKATCLASLSIVSSTAIISASISLTKLIFPCILSVTPALSNQHSAFSYSLIAR